jgi:hypothetical protein
MFQIEEGLAGLSSLPRVRAKGRYLFAGDTKFFIKGVTYGPFPENSRGEPLPEDATVIRDFDLMRRAGINAIRVYYVPPRHFLDLAAQAGIRVMVGIPWPEHLCFLDQWEVKEEIQKTVREAVAGLAGHPAILAWLIGNEIPSHIVRWHGAGKVEKFLAKLATIVREEDPEGMVTYANYPSTEYLRLPFIDFLSVNLCTTRRPSAPTSSGCRTWPANCRWSSPSSAWTPSATRRSTWLRPCPGSSRPPSSSACPAPWCSPGPTSGTPADI